jgi:hypothetical protein
MCNNSWQQTNSQLGRDRVRGNCQQSRGRPPDALVAKAADALNNPIVSLQEMPGVEYIVDSELVDEEMLSLLHFHKFKSGSLGGPPCNLFIWKQAEEMLRREEKWCLRICDNSDNLHLSSYYYCDNSGQCAGPRRRVAVYRVNIYILRRKAREAKKSAREEKRARRTRADLLKSIWSVRPFWATNRETVKITIIKYNCCRWREAAARLSDTVETRTFSQLIRYPMRLFSRHLSRDTMGLFKGVLQLPYFKYWQLPGFAPIRIRISLLSRVVTHSFSQQSKTAKLGKSSKKFSASSRGENAIIFSEVW